jgi:hypothetical protein
LLKLVILALLTTNFYATTFKVASYNVENLFDLKKDNSEYKEFIPYTKSKWNKENFQTKLSNTIKVLKELNAHIIALQETENIQVLELLQKELPSYKYFSFSKYKNSSVGLGFLSKIKIIGNEQINVKFRTKLFRPILGTHFELDNMSFTIYNNHWPSKRVGESYRIKYAKKLKNRLDKLAKDYDYILLGDFNSNYNEKESFKFNKKLNDTRGITGINHILNTSYKNKYITYENIFQDKVKVHYNLWFEEEHKNRFSSKYRKQNTTPDNIILSPALFDTKKISYIKNSFGILKTNYLYKNNQINRWKIKKGIHQGSGYSDHLPIYASFSTNTKDRNSLKNYKQTTISKIEDLYKKEQLSKPANLDDVIVIYKSKYSAIIKQKDNRAIYVYKNTEKLKLGYSYKLKIQTIKNFNGLKEITKFKVLNENNYIKNYQTLYKNIEDIKLLENLKQNEIITNLKGLYKNNYLYFKDKKIKIYAKDKSLLPRNNQNITIISAHLASYRGNTQLVIYKKDDYKEN